ncbi:hypothetical protein [Streptomyces nitrosporeus]|uniref:hypothetical protein n=1 Tax=Streptomyces nitrosporeus TaxID=28894 RepID=UPI00167D622E|nr:hypothetical protein [Streptomyces nitrosporeus]GGZ18452.1 hypothetical protein GCM10010327_56950 [Streptomyces nitrosporeus]
MSLTLSTPQSTGTCPHSRGTFETCTCTGISVDTHALQTGGYGGMEDDDNQRGYERDETDTSFHQLVERLVATGDTRARAAGRRSRRTLAEMMPGYDRQPVLRLVRPLEFKRADEACPLCGYWTCRCSGIAPAPTENSGQLQCDTCGTWFGYAGWTCSACMALRGLAALPMEPTPHERDGRTEPPPAPARPHAAVPVRHQP